MSLPTRCFCRWTKAVFCTEKIVHLPECYQCNDRKRMIATETPTRQEAGSNEARILRFNHNYRSRLPIFDVWMRLLSRIDGSVLWLLTTNFMPPNRTCAGSTARGIDPRRPGLCRACEAGRPLARHPLADLFVDTLLTTPTRRLRCVVGCLPLGDLPRRQLSAGRSLQACSRP